MNRLVRVALFAVLLLTVSACSVTGSTAMPTNSPVPVVPPSATPKAITASPPPQPASTSSAVNSLIDSCALLNSHDLASFFTSHAEVVLPKPEIKQVEHPIFSTGNAPGTETSCVYYTFHLPGSKSEVMLQVNYWLDLPAPTAPADAWAQDWTQTKSEATQTVSISGNEAFFNKGQLTFKTDNWYVTVEATETDLNLNTSAGVNQQLAIEKQVAVDMLARLG